MTIEEVLKLDKEIKEEEYDTTLINVKMTKKELRFYQSLVLKGELQKSVLGNLQELKQYVGSLLWSLDPRTSMSTTDREGHLTFEDKIEVTEQSRQRIDEILDETVDLIEHYDVRKGKA